MALAVSSAKVNISPGPGMEPYLGGYGDTTTRDSLGDFAPLYARCLVLWTDNKPHAIVSVDALGIGRSMHQAIRAAVIPLNSQWNSADFVLAATHTHNGPVLAEKLDPYISYGLTDLTLVNNYVSGLQTQIVNLVQTALASPKIPCTLDYQVATQNWSVNREGLSYKETAVPTLTARDPEGLPLAVLFGYGCHPVASGVQEFWDGDYPSVACSVIEAAIPGCFALFLQGAAGDQDPAGTRSWNLRAKLGAQLGSAVVGITNTVGRNITGPFTTALNDVSLPLDITNTPANMAAVRAIYVSRQGNGSLPIWYQRHAQKMIQQIDTSTFATTVPLPVQTWKLQGSPILRMAMTGGELVSGYAVYFRSLYGGNNGLFISAYVNETPAYVPSNELLPPIRGGGSYAGGWDTDFPGIAGGSMTVYGCLGRFKAGGAGVEAAFIAGVNAQLA